MTWQLVEKKIESRLLLGTARYPSLKILSDAITASRTEVITIALRRQAAHKENSLAFWEMIKKLGKHLLPNTAGCQSAKEAIMIAQMARDVFQTNWIKLEVTSDDYTLQPNPFELIAATKELIEQGFEVFPYCTDDLAVCERLIELGCKVVMPWGAPIGSGKGLNNPFALKTLRQRFPQITMLIDAGIGAPSHAAQALEWGFDGILLNSAVALAADPVKMARAFAHGIEAGRLAYEAGLMPARDFATPSTPLKDKPFWQRVEHE